MKASRVIKILTAAIPREAEWSTGEPYGPYNLDPDRSIKKVLFCVTPCQKVQDYFDTHRYDLLISHHPYRTDLPQLIFHTSLDCCEGGLNDVWRDALGVQDAQHFDANLGWYGPIEPIRFQDLVAKCEKFIDHKIIGQQYTKLDLIRSVVICSGLGGLVTDLALQTKADCYILGEMCGTAEASGFNSVIEIGHTLSERMGVELIRRLLPGVQVDSAPLEIDRFGGEVHRSR